jgi:uncharacterized ion transporter superfamily protein YfcC
MSNKKSLPGPITILMLVIILAAIATRLLPAGEYKKLSASENFFVLTAPSGDIVLPLNKRLRLCLKSIICNPQSQP